jgi:hypothetical protein
MFVVRLRTLQCLDASQQEGGHDLTSDSFRRGLGECLLSQSVDVFEPQPCRLRHRRAYSNTTPHTPRREKDCVKSGARRLFVALD